MCSQKFLTYGQKAFFTIWVQINHKMSISPKILISISTNEVLNESLWCQLPIACKKFENNNLKIQNLGKNSFCREKIYVKILTKCVISLEILNQFQQMRSYMKLYDTSFLLDAKMLRTKTKKSKFCSNYFLPQRIYQNSHKIYFWLLP